MITTLKKLTSNNKELSRNQLKKIRGLGAFCGITCDGYCGTKPGNDGVHYSAQKNFWEIHPHD